MPLLALGWFLRHRALAEDPQFDALRRWTLTWQSWSGTYFRDAVLTGADLRGADCRFARLARPRDLTHARFRDARNLHLAHVTGTILADRRVRALLVTGRGDGADLDHADLHGAWLVGASLRGARLTDAELTGADLSGADLTEADLSRATLIGADLTGAILTGACLDGWNIDAATRLDGVVAEYVFLAAGPDGHRHERRPQGDGRFGPGDFTTLFQQAIKTVDLIFHNGVDWTAFGIAIDRLRVRYGAQGKSGEQEVRVQAIENTADGRIIIRVAVPDGGDKDHDYRHLHDDYQQQVVALERRNERLQLEHKVSLAEIEAKHAKARERQVRKHGKELEKMMRDHAQRQQSIQYQINLQEGASMAGGDITQQTGDFRGSNVNVKSWLAHVTQTIGTLPDADAANRAELTRLVGELADLLQQVPPAQAAEAEAVATLTGELIDKAAATPRNPVLLKARADGLLTAARGLAERFSPILKVVDQILGLFGLG